MYKLENHSHWPVVKEVCRKLIENGKIAYLAGGCVRDYLLGRKPADFDVATDATPEEIQQIFEKTLSVGVKYGIVHVVIDGLSVEVGTFRKDGDYVDGRHPQQVGYSNAQEDAKRRDFTINAMFLDMATGQVIDYQGGKKDLQRHCIRAVGEPKNRFEEDYLRILRALRFAAQLGFEIDPKTWEALHGQGPRLGKLSVERIQQEWVKLLSADFPEKGLFSLRLLNYLPLMGSQMAHNFSAETAALFYRVTQRTRTWECRLACLYVGAESDAVKHDMKQLKFSNEHIRHTQQIHNSLQEILDRTTPLGRRIEIFNGETSFFAGVIGEELPREKNQPTAPENAMAHQYLKKYLQKQQGLPEVLVRGEDLKSFSEVEPRQYGDLLKRCRWIQLENPEWSKQQLIHSALKKPN